MQAGTEGSTPRKARGRKDSQGTEAVASAAPVMEVIEDLVQLKRKAQEAADRYNENVKKVAERAGLLSSVVNKLVTAKAGDKFEDEKKKVGQLALVFDAAEVAETETA